ncbi:hypothetical protein OOK41_28595 [Micromonospora sp. NBC_01655]|uniref:hypothetical protein n=1 Tax=Micromonospora sp. NBC_01655 TaxID=2975983 RepID=UPI002253AD86|nr:hypothetical protein [Micromonospora sp. NBC_01655]MCX4474221.1 hypothetical protein [Micromonospora sp. NBC_01655]
MRRYTSLDVDEAGLARLAEIVGLVADDLAAAAPPATGDGPTTPGRAAGRPPAAGGSPAEPGEAVAAGLRQLAAETRQVADLMRVVAGSVTAIDEIVAEQFAALARDRPDDR